jgi:hypothetical protein
MPVLEKSPFWNGHRDQLLRAYYNDKVKVSPAQLADFLGVIEKRVVNRLSELGLRNRRTTHYEQRSDYRRRRA